MGIEFDLIYRYFNLPHTREDVMLGVGDDGALLRTDANQALVVSTDTLIAGVHFPAMTPPEAVGYKALAVNLSDLAAMGATPAWVTLAITLPDANTDWVAAFMQGFARLLRQHNVALIGGDTTHGSLSITVQAMGFVKPKQSLRRDGAQCGDSIVVSGTLGDAAAGLQCLQAGRHEDDNEKALINRLFYPTPRCELGVELAGLAQSAIDISDGLCADLSHILEASGLGASISIANLPISDALQHILKQESLNFALHLALTGGDDYELLFTVAKEARPAINALSTRLGIPLTVIGQIEQAPGLRLFDAQGKRLELARMGYEHFASNLASVT